MYENDGHQEIGPKVVRPTHFQIGTIIITVDISHHRTSSSPLLSYEWVAMFSQFCTHIFSIPVIQYRLNIDPYNGVTAGKVSRFDDGYLRFGNLSDRCTKPYYIILHILMILAATPT